MAIALNTPIKRIIAFVLCFALFAMVIIPPQPAEAVAGAAALIAGAAVSSEVIGSVIATIILAATGVCFDNGFFGDTDNLSTAAYEVGYELVQDMILTGGNVATWIDEAIQAYQLLGGFTAGNEIEVPAEVLEYSRNWVNEKYDLSETIDISTYGLVFDGVLYPATLRLDNSVAGSLASHCSSVGISIPIDATASADTPMTISFGEYTVYYYSTSASAGCIGDNVNDSGNLTSSIDYQETYCGSENVICISLFRNIDGSYRFGTIADGLNYYAGYGKLHKFSADTTDFCNSLCAPSSITGTSALDTAQTENKTLYIPSTVDMGTIGDYSVPAIQTLTSDMVLDGPITDTETDEPTTPDTNIDTETDDFTVPDTWSGFDAWLKTQAQTVTDYTTIIANKVNGIATDVADFGVSIKEWINEKWGTFSDFVLTIPDIIALELEGILADVMEFFQTPINKIKEQLNNTKNRFLPFIQNGFGLLSIWYYVVAWVGSLGSWLSMMFTVWNGLPYAMVVPVYATAVIVVVIGMWRRFFH